MQDSHDDEAMRKAELEALAGKLEQQISDAKTFLMEAVKRLAMVRSHLAAFDHHKIKPTQPCADASPSPTDDVRRFDQPDPGLTPLQKGLDVERQMRPDRRVT